MQTQQTKLPEIGEYFRAYQIRDDFGHEAAVGAPFLRVNNEQKNARLICAVDTNKKERQFNISVWRLVKVYVVGKKKG